MAKKWIIQDGNLRLGHVDLHKELKSKTGNAVKGGGYWELDKEKKIIYLYGKSIDFGQCKLDDIINARNDGYAGPTLEEMDWVFSNHLTLGECFDNGTLIKSNYESEEDK